MAKHALFFNSIRGDRVYNSESFRTWLRKFFTNGVNSEGFIPSVGTATLTSEFTAGFIHINGATKYVAATTFGHSAAAGSGTQADNPRYDMIVAEYNENESVRDIILKVVEGQYTGDPSTSIPEPVRSGGIYQVPIAVFKIGTAGETFDPNTIDLYIDYHTATGSDYGATNMFIRSTITNKTDEQIAAEFTTYYALFSSTTEASFEAWFAAIKATLSASKAGSIKSGIDNANGIATQVAAKQVTIDETENRINGKLDSLESQVSGLISSTKFNASYLSTGGPDAAEAIRSSKVGYVNYEYRYYRSKFLGGGLGAGTASAGSVRTRSAEMAAPYQSGGYQPNYETQYRECGMAIGSSYNSYLIVDMQAGHQTAYLSDTFGDPYPVISGFVAARQIIFGSKTTSGGFTYATSVSSQTASKLSNYSYWQYSQVGEENTDASLDVYTYS